MRLHCTAPSMAFYLHVHSLCCLHANRDSRRTKGKSSLVRMTRNQAAFSCYRFAGQYHYVKT